MVEASVSNQEKERFQAGVKRRLKILQDVNRLTLLAQIPHALKRGADAHIAQPKKKPKLVAKNQAAIGTNKTECHDKPDSAGLIIDFDDNNKKVTSTVEEYKVDEIIPSTVRTGEISNNVNLPSDMSQNKTLPIRVVSYEDIQDTPERNDIKDLTGPSGDEKNQIIGISTTAHQEVNLPLDSHMSRKKTVSCEEVQREASRVQNRRFMPNYQNPRGSPMDTHDFETGM